MVGRGLQLEGTSLETLASKQPIHMAYALETFIPLEMFNVIFDPANYTLLFLCSDGISGSIMSLNLKF